MTSSHSAGGFKPDPVLRAIGPSERSGAWVLGLEGEFDMAGVPLFEAALETVPAAASLVLDLRELTFLDSSGLLALVGIERRQKEAGGRLRCVVAADGAVQRLIELTQLGLLLDVREEPDH